MKKIVFITFSVYILFILFMVFSASAADLVIKDPNSLLPDTQKVMIETREVTQEVTIRGWKNEIKRNVQLILGAEARKTELEVRNIILINKIKAAADLGLNPNQTAIVK